MTPIDPSDPIQRSLDAWGQHAARSLPGELKHSMQQQLKGRRAAPSYPALALSVGCIALAFALSLWWLTREPMRDKVLPAIEIVLQAPSTPPVHPSNSSDGAPSVEEWIADAQRLNLELAAIELDLRIAKLESSLNQSRDRLNQRISLDRVIASQQHNISSRFDWDTP